jgi:hypothetical protein
MKGSSSVPAPSVIDGRLLRAKRDADGGAAAREGQVVERADEHREETGAEQLVEARGHLEAEGPRAPQLVRAVVHDLFGQTERDVVGVALTTAEGRSLGDGGKRRRVLEIRDAAAGLEGVEATEQVMV